MMSQLIVNFAWKKLRSSSKDTVKHITERAKSQTSSKKVTVEYIRESAKSRTSSKKAAVECITESANNQISSQHDTVEKITEPAKSRTSSKHDRIEHITEPTKSQTPSKKDTVEHITEPGTSRTSKYYNRLKLTNPDKYAEHKAADALRKKSAYISINNKPKKQQASIRTNWRENKRRKRKKDGNLHSDTTAIKRKKIKDMTADERKEYNRMKKQEKRQNVSKVLTQKMTSLYFKQNEKYESLSTSKTDESDLATPETLSALGLCSHKLPLPSTLS